MSDETKPDNIIDAYGDYAGLSAMAEYLETRPAETINAGVRRWILNDIADNNASGKKSTEYQEARRLLKLESAARFGLRLTSHPSVWSLLARLLRSLFG